MIAPSRSFPEDAKVQEKPAGKCVVPQMPVTYWFPVRRAPFLEPTVEK
jgi:hypothetical protein